MNEEPIKRGPGRPRKPRPDVVPPKGKAGRPISPIAEARRMTVREYAMTHVFDALDVWAQIMKDEDQPGTARAAAAAHIVNRAIGQPAQAQAVEADSADQIPETNVMKLKGLSDTALEEIARAEAKAG